jgi:hypothetical protein
MWLFTPIVQLYLLHLVVLTIASLWPGSSRPRRGVSLSATRGRAIHPTPLRDQL